MRQGQEGRGRKSKTPAEQAIHMSERDQADLARFRAAAAKLTTRQKGEVIRQMLGMPDTP